MRPLSFAFIVSAALTAASATAGAQMPVPDAGAAPSHVLDLTFEADGNVTLSAKNVTIREILAEWARQCGCYVVNAEKLPGGPIPVPLLFPHQPQGKVLDSLLRTAAGYVLTPQREGSTSRSSFETIYILATSSPVNAGYTAPVSTASAFPLPTTGSPEDEIAPVTPMSSGPPRPMGPMPPGAGPTPSASTAPPPAYPTPHVPGVPASFVPIVPIGSSQTMQTPGSSTAVGAPGAMTAAPGTMTVAPPGSSSPTSPAAPPPAQLPPPGR